MQGVYRVAFTSVRVLFLFFLFFLCVFLFWSTYTPRMPRILRTYPAHIPNTPHTHMTPTVRYMRWMCEGHSGPVTGVYREACTIVRVFSCLFMCVHVFYCFDLHIPHIRTACPSHPHIPRTNIPHPIRRHDNTREGRGSVMLGV